MKYLIDIGSSTVKIAKRAEGQITSIGSKTFSFKKGFDKAIGITQTLEDELVDYLNVYISKHQLSNRNTKIYATGVFRDIVDPKPFISRFFAKTGLYFNIISHDLEAFYLEKAWINEKSKKIDNLLVINIGGGTTELLLCHRGKLNGDPIKLNFGVSSIKKEFSGLNEKYSVHSLKKVVDYVYNQILEAVGDNIGQYQAAIYTGGELKYMQCTGYKLQQNTIFSDVLHPDMIQLRDYKLKNEQVYSEISLEELKSMMPDNPQWMEGARPCSAIAEAICEFFGVQYIIPSDTNLLDGVNIQEAETVVLCGSYNRYLDRIIDLKKKLETKGIRVLMPDDTETAGYDGDFLLFKSNVIANHSSWDEEQEHLNAIRKCDLVIACNFDGYLGVSSTFELERAYKYNKKIVFLEDSEIADSFGKRIDVDLLPCEVGML